MFAREFIVSLSKTIKLKNGKEFKFLTLSLFSMQRYFLTFGYVFGDNRIFGKETRGNVHVLKDFHKCAKYV